MGTRTSKRELLVESANAISVIGSIPPGSATVKSALVPAVIRFTAQSGPVDVAKSDVGRSIETERRVVGDHAFLAVDDQDDIAADGEEGAPQS